MIWVVDFSKKLIPEEIPFHLLAVTVSRPFHDLVPRSTIRCEVIALWLRPRRRLKRPLSHVSWFLKTNENQKISHGTASCIKFWYSPRAAHTRHNAEHLQQTCKKLVKKTTSKKLRRACRKLQIHWQETQRVYKELARDPPNKISKSQTAYCILQTDSNRKEDRSS